MAQGDDGIDDGGIAPLWRQRGDEAPVYLELVGGKALEVEQAGVAGAEVVDGDAKPELGQAVEDGQALLGVLHGGGFGDFQSQVTGLQPMAGEGGFHLFQQAGAGQLYGGEIDGHAPVRVSRVTPAAHLAARLIDDPVADGDDESALLRQGQEAGRRDGPLLRVLPAQQGLGTDHLAATGSVFGLVVQGELPPLQGVLQLLLQQELLVGVGVHGAVKVVVVVAPPLLGVVHGGVGVEGQLVQAGAVLGIDRNADAGGDVQAVVFTLIGLCQRGQQTLGEGCGLADVPRRQGQHELIPPEARGGIIGAKQSSDPLRHFDQQQIPGVVAVGIVDDLEAVEIEKQQGEAALAVLTLLNALLQAVGEQQPVGQPGQAVVQRQLEQLVVGLVEGGREARCVGIQHGEHQGDGEYRQGHDDDHGRQPLGIEPGVEGNAQTPLRKLGRRHAGVVHANDGAAHDEGGASLAEEGVRAAVAQPERNPEGGPRGEHGDEDGEDEEPPLVVNAGHYLHGRHADVVHGGDPGTHQHGPEQDPSPGELGAAHQPEGEGRRADGRDQGETGEGEIVAERDGQVEGEHADEVHGPDTEPHGKGTPREPEGGAPSLALAHPARHVQRRVGGEHRQQDGEEHQVVAVITVEHGVGRGHLIHSGMDNGLSHGLAGEKNRAEDCTQDVSQTV